MTTQTVSESPLTSSNSSFLYLYSEDDKIL